MSTTSSVGHKATTSSHGGAASSKSEKSERSAKDTPRPEKATSASRALDSHAGVSRFDAKDAASGKGAANAGTLTTKVTLNVRSQPNTDNATNAPKDAFAPGATLVIQTPPAGQNAPEGWQCVKGVGTSGTVQTGWVSANPEYVAAAEGPGAPADAGDLGTVVPRVTLNVRNQPNTDNSVNPPVDQFAPGTPLKVLPPPDGKAQPGWAYVEGTGVSGQPRTGWVSTDPQLARVLPPGVDPRGDSATAANLYAAAQNHLANEANDASWDFYCLKFVDTVAHEAGVNDPALDGSGTPLQVIANLPPDRLHPMSEPPPPGAVVLWDKGGYPDDNGDLVQTGHVAIYAGTDDKGEPLYITTRVDDQSGVMQRTIRSLQDDGTGTWPATPPVGWFIPENP